MRELADTSSDALIGASLECGDDRQQHGSVVRELGEVLVGQIGGAAQTPGVDAGKNLGSLTALSRERRFRQGTTRLGRCIHGSIVVKPAVGSLESRFPGRNRALLRTVCFVGRPRAI